MKKFLALLSCLGAFALLGATTNDAELFAQRLAQSNVFLVPPHVLFGHVPDQLDPSLPLPHGAKLLGTVIDISGGMIELYYDVDNAQAAAASYGAALVAAGYSTPPRVGPGRGGFVTAGATGRFITMYCRGSNGLWIVVPKGGTGDLRVSVFPNSFTSCARLSGESELSNPIPELTAPTGASLSLAGGSSGVGFSVIGREISLNAESNARIETSWSAGSVLTHFNDEMRAAGWRLTEQLIGAQMASARYDYSGAQGEHWSALLMLYRDRPRVFQAHLTATGTESHLFGDKRGSQ